MEVPRTGEADPVGYFSFLLTDFNVYLYLVE